MRKYNFAIGVLGMLIAVACVEYFLQPVQRIIGEMNGKKCLQKGNNCVDYGDYLLDVKNNVKEYWSALKQGCASGDSRSCSRMEKDERDGKEYALKCKIGDGEACYVYGWGSVLMMKRYAQGKKYLKMGCDMKHEPSCAKLGELELLGD